MSELSELERRITRLERENEAIAKLLAELVTRMGYLVAPKVHECHRPDGWGKTTTPFPTSRDGCPG